MLPSLLNFKLISSSVSLPFIVISPILFEYRQIRYFFSLLGVIFNLPILYPFEPVLILPIVISFFLFLAFSIFSFSFFFIVVSFFEM